jgi:tetratricopeptide (TPR) repeat protein
MKRLICIAAGLAAAVLSFAQSERYEQRYDLLVSQFGPAGVGVETVLNNWSKVDSTNVKMLSGRFLYYFTKAQTLKVEPRSGKKYLGMEPMLTLKDSLGNDVYYYQMTVYDDELYGESLKVIDKAVSFWPDRLDFRFMKANAYIAYEKESPDMALSYLMDLADRQKAGKTSWTYDGKEADDEFFQGAMQEYCYSLYALGTPSAYDAFLKLSQKLSSLYPANTDFLDNIGSYYLIVKQDYKNAYKYYNKALKLDPKDETAMRNALTAAKRQKNAKLEKKYQAMLDELKNVQ